MTYNILDGGAQREALILQVIRSLNPDVIVLQEVFQAELVYNLAETLGMESYFAESNYKRHMALLSRLPIVSRKSYHPFPPILRTIAEAEIEYAPGKTLFLWGVHLISMPSVIFELWRLWEIKRVLARAKQRAASPAVILGDFNAIAPGDKVIVKEMPAYLRLMVGLQGGRMFRFAIGEVLSAGFTDCFRHLHSDQAGFTLPPPKPNARLDYIFANRTLTPLLAKCSVGYELPEAAQASDHYPVTADFAL